MGCLRRPAVPSLPFRIIDEEEPTSSVCRCVSSRYGHAGRTVKRCYAVLLGRCVAGIRGVEGGKHQRTERR
jgi:hypothetical protein